MERSIFSMSRRCACGNVRMATRAITHFYDQQLKPSGLRSTQFSFLLNIYLNEEIMVTKLAKLLLMDTTTVTRNLQVLIRLGYIGMTREKGNPRKKVFIIPKGMDKLTEAMPLWENAQTYIENKLGQARFRELLKTLSEIDALPK
jgi:MarR family transcriptional regulator, organic hydroperoxide resistance regulator